jgi:glycosyltransferase involved in cell wall biosynthesis
MSRPLVSVITTVHNLERYVERCITSVQAQSYTHWEQIIVDDGSTDGTADRIARFADPRIRYIRLPHRGVGALAESYNTALGVATGELVAILEGDDYWPPEKLARQVPAFDDPEVQLAWGRAVVVDTTDRALWKWPATRLQGGEISLRELFQRLTCANVLTPTVTVIVRRTALDAVGGFHQPRGVLFVDLPTWLMISASVPGKARMVKALLGYYRMHDAQMSTQYYHEYQTSQSAVVDAILSQCDSGALERLGWNDRQRQYSHASSELAAGLASLRLGNRRDARASLRSALLRTGSSRAKLRAILGLISTFLPYDLVFAADRTRRAVLGVSQRLSRAERASH